MTSIKIIQGDTIPLNTQLSWADGTNVDLTSASSVKFMMMKWGSIIATVSAACTIVTPIEGIVKYTWGAGETDTVGFYQVQWEITYTDGTIYTVPTDGKKYLIITGELG